MDKMKTKLILMIFIVGTFILLVNIVSAVSQSISLDVVETRDFKVDFIAIDEKTSTFEETVSGNTEFISATYPLTGENLIVGINYEVLPSSIGSTLENDELYPLVKNIYKKGRLSRSTDRVVGIVQDGWFSDHGQSGKGVAPLSKPLLGSLRYTAQAVIIEEGIMQASSHEIGHTFGLCDEYDKNVWVQQNDFWGSCPNGDADGDGNLDDICLEYPSGCPTSTIGKLVPWSGASEFMDMKNFMGAANQPNLKWVDKVSYNHLLNTFSSTYSFLSVDWGILISGTIDKNGNVNVDDYSYILDEQSILNESTPGNFTLTIEENGSILYEMDFQPEFLVAFMGGNITEVNVSAFSFVVPFSDNVTKLLIKENNVTKDEVTRTANTPSLNITSNLSGRFFNNELFEISWESSDLDGDDLVYAVLFSDDNGSNYTTLEIDYNQTSLTLNSSNLPSCNLCKIKILATDGINTNSSISDTFGLGSIVNLHTLIQLYSNNTENIFGFFIENLDEDAIQNVSWEINTGEINITSQYNSTLEVDKSKYVIVEYNYASTGNYTVIATTSVGEASDSESIGIEVI